MKYIGVSTPAWTIVGDEKRSAYKNLKAYQGAGPSDFPIENADGTVYEMAPSYSIGRQKRGKWMDMNPETKNIGPGSYEATTMFNSTAPSENQDSRAMKYAENKPVFWKSTKRFQRPSGLSKVAPNTYDPRPVKPSAPIRSFGYKFDSLRPGSAMPSLGPG